MAKSRERWLIGLAGVAAIVITVLLALHLITERNRGAAVEKLKATLIDVPALPAFERAIQGQQTATESATGQPPLETLPASQPDEDRSARFKTLFDEKTGIPSDPVWEEIDERLGKSMREWTEEDREEVATYIAANREVILELRRLAELGGPICHLDYAQGYAMELPHLAQMRDCARLLTADAMLMAQRGDYDEAIEDLVAAMRLAEALEDEPILISQLVRMAMDGIVYNAVQEFVPAENLPPELARTLIEFASDAQGREAFANSYSGEGLFGLQAFEGIRAGDSSVTSALATDDVQRILFRVYGSTLARPWLNMDEEAYADIMTRQGEAVRLPFYEAKPLLDEFESEILELPRTRLITRTLVPALGRAAEAQAWNEARLDLMQLGLAIEQYRAENGQCPESLEAIASMVGGSIPLDPFTGQPFVYQPSGDTFRLYSQAGSVIELNDHRRRGLGVDAQGNLVWRAVHN